MTQPLLSRALPLLALGAIAGTLLTIPEAAAQTSDLDCEGLSADPDAGSVTHSCSWRTGMWGEVFNAGFDCVRDPNETVGVRCNALE